MGGNLNAFKIAEFVFAILGLVFALTSSYHDKGFIGIWACCVVYTLIMVICILFGKNFLSSTCQAVVEILFGVFLLIFCIIIWSTYSLDTLLLLATIVGFILAALFFISAYEKM